MAEKFDIEIVRANLRRFMALRDIKPTTLSLKIGDSKTVVKELLEKNADVKIGTLHRLAEALNVGLVDLVTSQGEVVPIEVRMKWPQLSTEDQNRVGTFVKALPRK